MTDGKALIERLRSGRWLGETTGAKAADYIERLEAENVRLRGAVIEYKQGYGPGDGNSAVINKAQR